MARKPKQTTTLDLPEGELAYVDFTQLVPDPDNVRTQYTEIEELADAIARDGLLNPLSVLPATEDGLHLIRHGHRRHKALELLVQRGWPGRNVPVVIRQVEPADVAAEQLVENLQRVELDPVDEAYAFGRLVDEFEWAPTDVAQRIGRPKEYVTRRLALRSLPEPYHAALRAKRLTIDDAVSMAKHDVALLTKLIKNDRLPLLADVESAARKAKLAKIQDEFVAYAKESNLAFKKGSQPYGPRVMVLGSAESVKELRGSLAAGSVTSDTVLYIMMESWATRVVGTLIRELSDEEFKAKQEAEKTHHAAVREKQEAERAAQLEAQREAMSPEEREWHATCDAIRAANRQAHQAWRDGRATMLATWCRSVSVTNIARWLSVLFLVDMDNGLRWARSEDVLAAFGIEYPEAMTAHDALRQHVTAKPADAPPIALYHVLDDWIGAVHFTDEELDAIQDEVNDTLWSIIKAMLRGMTDLPPAPEELPLPPKPGTEPTEPADVDEDAPGEYGDDED